MYIKKILDFYTKYDIMNISNEREVCGSVAEFDDDDKITLIKAKLVNA